MEVRRVCLVLTCLFSTSILLSGCSSQPLESSSSRRLLQVTSEQELQDALKAPPPNGVAVTLTNDIVITTPIILSSTAPLRVAIAGKGKKAAISCAPGLSGAAFTFKSVALSMSNVIIRGCASGVLTATGTGSSLSLSEVDVTDCTAPATGLQGVFYTNGSTVSVSGCTFKGNRGPALMQITTAPGGIVEMTKTSFTGNTMATLLNITNLRALAVPPADIVYNIDAFNVKGYSKMKRHLAAANLVDVTFLNNSIGTALNASRVDVRMSGCSAVGNTNLVILLRTYQGALSMTKCRLSTNTGDLLASDLVKVILGTVGLTILDTCEISGNQVGSGINLLGHTIFRNYANGTLGRAASNDRYNKLENPSRPYKSFAAYSEAKIKVLNEDRLSKRDDPLLLVGCTFHDNTFGYGGVYGVGGPVDKGVGVRILSTNFTNNRVVNEQGPYASRNASIVALVASMEAYLEMQDVSVTNNTAINGCIVNATNALLNTTNTVLTGNVAERGWVLGVVYASALINNTTAVGNSGKDVVSTYQAFLILSDLTMQNNIAKEHVMVTNLTSMVMTDGRFSINQAGGAVMVMDGGFYSMKGYSFTDNKAVMAVVNPKAFNDGHSTLPTISFTNFTGNTVNGMEGGAVLLGNGSDQYKLLVISNCSFVRNTLTNTPTNSALGVTSEEAPEIPVTVMARGAAIRSIGPHTFHIRSTTFEDNVVVGGDGGAVHTASRVLIDNCTFTRNKAMSGLGGAVACDRCPHLNLFNSTFTQNSARGGGALVLAPAGDDADVEPWNRNPCTVNQTRFTDNTAILKESKGPVVLTASDWDNVNNSCPVGAGGAICVHPRYNTTIAEVKISGSSATWGGAMFVNNGGLSTRGLCLLTLCGNTLSNNTISSGGGSAMFLTSVGRTTCVTCESNCTLASGNSTLEDCPSWSNNVAASTASKKQIVTGPIYIQVQSMNDARYYKTRRGAPIEANVSLLDYFKEPIPMLPYKAQMKVSHSSQDGDEVMVVSRYKPVNSSTTYYTMRSDAGMLSVDAQRSQNFSLDFTVDGSETNDVYSLGIQLRSCLPGEYQSVTGGCYECETGSFVQDPAVGVCNPCPVGANCIVTNSTKNSNTSTKKGKGVMVPAERYWQSTPHSPQVHLCPLEGSCTVDRRKNDGVLRSFLLDKNDEFLAMWINDSSSSSTKRPGSRLNSTAYAALVAQYNKLQCAPGYTGHLCGVCDKNYGRWSSRCIRCVSRALNNVFILMACAMLAAVLSFTVFSHIQASAQKSMALRESRENMSTPDSELQDVKAQSDTSTATSVGLPPPPPQPRVSDTDDIQVKDVKQGTFGRLGRLRLPVAVNPANRTRTKILLSIAKIMVSYVQVLSITRNVQLSWPTTLKRFMSNLDFTSGPGNYIALDCSFTGSTAKKAYLRTITMSTLPVMISGVAVLFWLVATLLQRKSLTGWRSIRKYFHVHLILTVVQICYYLYPLVSSSLFQVFTCEELDDPTTSLGKSYTAVTEEYMVEGKFWAQNYDTQCWTGGHMLLTYFLALPGVMLFTIGFPLFSAFILFANRKKLDDHLVILKYGFLYEEYQDDFYFWEAVIMLRKAALLVCTIFLRTRGAVVQLLTAGIVSTICLILQEIYRPFDNQLLNRLERLSLSSVIFNILVLGYFLPSSNVPQGWRVALSVLMIVGNGLVLSVFVLHLLWVGVELVRAFLGERNGGDTTQSRIMDIVTGARCFGCGKKNQPVV